MPSSPSMAVCSFDTRIKKWAERSVLGSFQASPQAYHIGATFIMLAPNGSGGIDDSIPSSKVVYIRSLETSKPRILLYEEVFLVTSHRDYLEDLTMHRPSSSTLLARGHWGC